MQPLFPKLFVPFPLRFPQTVRYPARIPPKLYVPKAPISPKLFVLFHPIPPKLFVLFGHIPQTVR